MVAGQIGLSFDSGKIRYKGTVEVKDGSLSVAMINTIVDRGMSILDHFLPAVMAVTHANVHPEDAFSTVDEVNSKKKRYYVAVAILNNNQHVKCRMHRLPGLHSAAIPQ